MQLSFFKRCCTCKQVKLFIEFNSRRNAIDGRDWRCKDCNKKALLAYSETHREEIKEKTRKWVASNKERKKENDKAYRVSEGGKLVRKASRDRTSPQNVERAKRWSENNPERYQINQWHGKRNRRARLVGAEGSFSKEEFDSLCASYDFVCLCCKAHKPLEADHVIPLSQGGSNTIDNIQPLCRSCNAHKHGKIIDYR